MSHSKAEATLIPDVTSLPLSNSQPPIYDRPIELSPLRLDPVGAGEHYVIHYPTGLRTQRHLHTAAHSIVVLKGRLTVNGQLLESNGYAFLPGGQVHHHEPDEGAGCTFITFFHGAFDVASEAEVK